MLRKSWLTKKSKLRVFISDLIKFSIDESISGKSFLEHFKRIFKKSKLMKKLKSRDVNLIFEEFENTTRTACIFVLKGLRQSNLNFKTKTLIELSFKRLKFSSQTSFLRFCCWHVQQTHSKSLFFSSHSTNATSFWKIRHLYSRSSCEQHVEKNI